MFLNAEISDNKYNFIRESLSKKWGIPVDTIVMYREHYHFGILPSFRNSVNEEKLFYIGGEEQFIDWNEVKKTLKRVWAPVDNDSVMWYNSNLF